MSELAKLQVIQKMTDNPLKEAIQKNVQSLRKKCGKNLIKTDIYCCFLQIN